METIDLHIEYLLAHHDCVILPGVGAFLVSRRAAVFSPETGLFQPPMTRICFNAAITNDDGLLVNSIRRRGEMSFPEARRVMESQIEALRASLSRDGEVTVGNIGVLIVGEEGNLSFRPLRADQNRIGLPSIDVKPLMAAPAAAAPAPLKSEEPVVEVAPDDEAAAEEAAAGKYYRLSISKRLVRMAACLTVVALVGAAILAGVFVGNRPQAPAEASVLPVREIVVEKPAQPVVEKPASGVAADEWCLVVASFLSEEKAELFISQHDDSDYGLEVRRCGKKYHVSAASSADKSSLLSLSSDSDFRSEYSQSWIWKVKDEDKK